MTNDKMTIVSTASESGFMNLAIDTNCILPGRVGGIENYTLGLIEALRLPQSPVSSRSSGSMTTLSSVRLRGSLVVSLSWSARISPRPADMPAFCAWAL